MLTRPHMMGLLFLLFRYTQTMMQDPAIAVIMN
jgi:hypothetical protein